jgi:hypothetical protein
MPEPIRFLAAVALAGVRTALFAPDLDRLFLAARAERGEAASIWIFRPLP